MTSWRAHFDAFEAEDEQSHRRVALESAREWVVAAPSDAVAGVREALNAGYWPQLWAAKLFCEFEMPVELRGDFVQMVLNRGDPSDNRYFVDALAYSMGGGGAAHAILEALHNESEAEVIATANAFYWLLPHGLPWRARWFLLRELLRAREPAVRKSLWSVLTQ